MNRKLTIHLLGMMLLLEAASMLPSLVISLMYKESCYLSFIQTIVLLVAVGLPPLLLARPERTQLRAREGFLVVSLSWVLMSAFGALPLMFSGVLPNYFDAFFEAVSGFTTTGATVVTDFEHMPNGIMFWRSFTHWVGGMGVLVLTLALLPKMTGHTSHLVRAESPGLSLTKVVPKMGDTAKILYLIYIAMTLLEAGILWLAGMEPFDAVVHAMSTAGTGGFSNRSNSIAGFNSPTIEIIITVFMILFGINFALYFQLFSGGWKNVLKSEELHWFGGIVLVSILVLTLIILPVYGNFGEALRNSSFNVASIISTTGFCTVDYDAWPLAGRALLVMIMFIGSCAGSTAGGLKVVRFGILCKTARREIRRTFHPNKAEVVLFEGKRVDEPTLASVSGFFFVYLALVVGGSFLISLNGIGDYATSFTAALTCVSNVGPGLSAIGPRFGFAPFSSFSKVVMSFLMLCGRLELYPILILFTPSIWKKH